MGRTRHQEIGTTLKEELMHKGLVVALAGLLSTCGCVEVDDGTTVGPDDDDTIVDPDDDDSVDDDDSGDDDDDDDDSGAAPGPGPVGALAAPGDHELMLFEGGVAQVPLSGTSHLAEQFTPIDDDEWLSDGAHGRG
jgi:hypothetical protein